MILLLVAILIMPFEQNPHLYIASSVLGLVGDFTAIKLLGVLGFSWALCRIVTGSGGEPVFRSRQARLFAALILVTLVSAALNGSAYMAIVKYVALIMFLPFVLVSVQTEEDLRRVLKTIVIAMTLVVPYALWQLARWSGRLGVGLSEPNYFAANLLLIIPIAFALASREASRGKRMLWIGAGLLLVMAVLLTSSRGGYIGLLVAVMIYTFRRFGTVGAVAALVLLVLVALPLDIGQRAVATIVSTDAPAPAGLRESTHAHTALFWGGVQMVTDAPVFGVGPQKFKDYSQHYSGLSTAYIAHNTYIELAAEAGVPVLILFLLLLTTVVGVLSRVTKVAADGSDLAAWADGVRTGIIGFAVASMFISTQYEKMFWLAVFLSIVVGRLASRPLAAEPT